MRRHSGSAFSLMGAAMRMVMLLGFSLMAALGLLPFASTTVSAATVQTRLAQHALLVSSKPAADAVLQAPPTSVHMVFSETLNPALSKALVVNTTNRQVDMKDSHTSNGVDMDLTLPLLNAGTYVVVWQTESAIDGHVARGSFIFRIARPDGSVPPIPAVLPTGNVPGAAGVGVQSGASLDGPTLLQTVATWIALLLFTFWVGGIIWETWVFPPKSLFERVGARHDRSETKGTMSTEERGRTSDERVGSAQGTTPTNRDPSFGHTSAVEQAARRWRRYAPYALVGILIADVGIIAGQAAELAGDWSGSIALPLLHAILVESQFGVFWWLREVATLAALVFTVVQNVSLRRGDASTRARTPGAKVFGAEAVASSETVSSAYPEPSAYATEETLLSGGSALMKVLADLPHLPRHLIKGIRQRSWFGHVEGLLALTLLFAFALSGHAAAVPSSVAWAVIGVDLVHLLADAAWVGGLLYIGVVLLPTLNKQSSYDWAGTLAIGLPRFSLIAVVSVILLATTGTFNTTEHLTSFEQFWTTAYGRTLTIKIIVFVIMMGISAYHAFFLRPRLVCALVETDAVEEGFASVGTGRSQEVDRSPITAAQEISRSEAADQGIGRSPLPPVREEVAMDAEPSGSQNGSSQTHNDTISSHALMLGKRLEQWLRVESMLGAMILLCVALLAAFAGSLSVSTAPTRSHQPTGPVTLTQTVDGGYTITLKVTPATFGTNTFTVLVKNAQGQPETGAGVSITTDMLDMNMGTDTTQLQANTQQPGVYSGQTDLTMAGNWEVDVRILPATSDTFVKAAFQFSAA